MSVAWKARFVLFLIVIALAAANADAAGFVHNANFSVFTPAGPSADFLAKEVLQKAEQYRREIALQWLGGELPPSIGRAWAGQLFFGKRCSEDRSMPIQSIPALSRRKF